MYEGIASCTIDAQAYYHYTGMCTVHETLHVIVECTNFLDKQINVHVQKLIRSIVIEYRLK